MPHSFDSTTPEYDNCRSRRRKGDPKSRSGYRTGLIPDVKVHDTAEHALACCHPLQSSFLSERRHGSALTPRSAWERSQQYGHTVLSQPKESSIPHERETVNVLGLENVLAWPYWFSLGMVGH